MRTFRKTFLGGTVLTLAVFLALTASPAQAWPADPWYLGEALQTTRSSSGSFLGVHVMELTAERGKQLNLKEVHGVELTQVEAESPAAKAGLQKGDVVLFFNGQRVEGTEQFMRLVRETPPGRTVNLQISREGNQQTVAVTTGERKRRALVIGAGQNFEIPRIEIPEINIPDIPRPFMTWRSSRLGIEAESVDSQLAEYFGVKEGVLVRRVLQNSAAEKAGLKAGDVILKIEDRTVTTPQEVASAVRGVSGTKTVPVLISRERREMTVNVTIEQPATPEGREFRGLRPGRTVVVSPQYDRL